MRILVTGADGRLGARVANILQDRHEVESADIAQFDITDFAATRQYVRDCQPELVIHPAAWTDVDACAEDPQRALEINAYGAQNVAVAAQEQGAALVYVSSNEVFDGARGEAYSEYDRANPVNPYAYSKWIGERAVSSVNQRVYIVRTAWLFAHGGRNFIHAILGAAGDGRALRVVMDEVANPTYTFDLAHAIAKLIETHRYGTYHLVNEGACSRFSFARYILDQAGFAETPIEAIASAEWSRASTPPPYTPLKNIAGSMLGISLRPWREAVDAFLETEGLLK